MAKPGVDTQGAQRGSSELRQRLMFVLGAIIIFRLGSFVPIPGIDGAVLAEFYQQQKDTIIGMFNMFSGGALERASVVCAGHYALHYRFDYHAVADRGPPGHGRAEKRRRGRT